jgi:carbon-monoxide dehydrogenase medium subunit
LVLLLREGLVSADHLVDIKGVPELGGVHINDEGLLVLGATCTHDRLSGDPLIREHLPVLAEMEGRLANQRVRNAGTLGGNLAFAEPRADPPALLVAADAQLRLEGPDGARIVSLAGWIAGPFEVDLEPGEILAEIAVPLPGPGTAFGYRRFKALERPSVTAAVRLTTGADGRIAGGAVVLGCLGGAPQPIEAAAGLLTGLAVGDLARVVPDLAAAVTAEAETVDDPHGPEPYKRHLAGVLAGRALRDAATRLDGASRS